MSSNSDDSSFSQLSQAIPSGLGEIPSRITSILGINEVIRQQIELGRQMAQNTENLAPASEDHISIPIDSRFDDYPENSTQRPLPRNPREDDEDDDPTNTDSSRIDLQIFRWIENSHSFLLLLLGLFLYQHKYGILLFIWHFSVMYHSNRALKKQVALKENRQVSLLLGIIGILGLHLALTYLLFQSSSNLWRSLFLLPPSTNISIWEVLWYITMNDIMVRFATMIAKSIFIILLGKLPLRKRKGQIYNIIEVTSHLYRSVLPIPIWFTFFLNDDNGQIFSCIIGGLYLTFKLTDLLRKSKQYVSTLKSYLLREVPFGVYASQEEVAECGDMCSICQEKMTSPVKLSCNHIFCESCISEWFEREKTCPLCRKVIKSAMVLNHSDGSTSLLLQLF